MIPVPLMEDGPDMEMVEAMVRGGCFHQGLYGAFPFIPILRGVCYSDRVVDRLASMETGCPGFQDILG